MSVVTKIEAQKRNDKRVNIYLDGEYFISIFKELVFTFSLKKGMEIDRDYLNSLLEDEMYLKAKDKALSILSRADQSEKKIREKLSTDYTEDVVEKVIEFLKNYNFINDSMLAERIVNDNVNIGKFGPNRIKQNLYRKGIDQSIIDEAVSSIDRYEEYENAKYLAEKRMKRLKCEDKRKDYQKVYQHLAYKGFSYDIINRVLKELFNFDEYSY